jgi:hypothetical protein
VLAELRRLAVGSISEQIASEDVTDEFVDTEARLRNHKRLEEQLLELLKIAHDVEAALKVHHELAERRPRQARRTGGRRGHHRGRDPAGRRLSAGCAVGVRATRRHLPARAQARAQSA